MYRIWFERPLPPEHAHMLDGIAVVAGPATATPEMPYIDLPGAQAIIAAARTQYTGALMDHVPTLRTIVRMGIGYDNIDLVAATERGIVVCNVPEGPSISTAEHTVALMLATVKQIRQIQQILLQGEPIDFFTAYRGIELHGLCLGLIGFGRIGQHVAGIARALGMIVVVYDLQPNRLRAEELGVRLAESLEEILVGSDVVSVHIPLSPLTYHLLDAERLALMKPGSYLINTSRGGIVDEEALLNALEQGHLQGAGLDVFEHEPPSPAHPLLQRADVVATPHIAGATSAAKGRLWAGAISQALQVLGGQRPPFVVNSAVWPAGQLEPRSVRGGEEGRSELPAWRTEL